jgi:hypothetical protein
MPVTMVMAMMPAVPPMMAMVPPMHFRGRQPGVVLNRRRGAGIAQRQRVGALGWSCERQQRANGGEPHNFRDKNFRERHECSPSVGCHVCAESLAATLHAIWSPRLERVLNECATKMNANGTRRGFKIFTRAKPGLDWRRIFDSTFCMEIAMTSFRTRMPISRAAPAMTAIAAAAWWSGAALASQGPGGGMGTASPLTQTVMAVLVYGMSAIVVGAGLILAALRRRRAG